MVTFHVVSGGETFRHTVIQGPNESDPDFSARAAGELATFLHDHPPDQQ